MSKKHVTDIPKKSQIMIGSTVSIETKSNQGTGNLTEGIVKEILTSGEIHPHGIKVRLEDGQVGRVKKITGTVSSVVKKQDDNQEFVDLDKKEIPKTEDDQNEFKEFYQYDKKLEFEDNRQAIENIQKSVQERMVITICSFGNSSTGGFLYLGINDAGKIVGLERDLKFGKFSNYEDKFANHIRDTLEKMIKDKVFIVSKIKIKFRDVEGKMICIIQVLPSNQPLYLHTKEKAFFVRGPTPRAEKLEESDQFRYIKERFPNYG